jgi:ABC-2 type transport system ATP-binding protein
MRACSIAHRFGDRVVLDDVSLEVPAGSVVGLLGPNGAGKSTFMRILFGVLEPDGGRVLWHDRDATAADRREWGYMPQERGLYRDMRVLDHLVWLARLHGVDRHAAVTKASTLLERLGIDDRADDEVKNLSGGMAQRVQLAAAMVHDPPVLVLDEPFAGLDPTAVGFLSDVVLAHAAGGGRVLFSSHQLDLVEDLCETITMIDHGRVVLQGDVRALKHASPDRYLHVDAAVPAELVTRSGSTVVEDNATGTRLRLAPEQNALLLLDEIRDHATVTEFGVDAPKLSELFRQAVGGGGSRP